MEQWKILWGLTIAVLAFILLPTKQFIFVLGSEDDDYVSAIGDPGMRRDGLRVAIEAWNQCNEVGEEAPGMGTPRMADCFDIIERNSSTTLSSSLKLLHRVKEKDNKIGIKSSFFKGLKTSNVNTYAALKEIYLGKKCRVKDSPRPWEFWKIMLKSGNMDTTAQKCPENGRRSKPFPPESRFPCFGHGCMNMPYIFHDYTRLVNNSTALKGGFYGTWDLDSNINELFNKNNNGDSNTAPAAASYYSITWEKEVGKGSWVFHHLLRTSPKYPWLMLYLRADATRGLSGGSHYPTRGISKIIPKSPNFKVRFKLEVKQGGGPKSQFYLMDMGSCWKNDGNPCDGDVTTDVTRYSEMILNPSTDAWCRPEDLSSCPPYHTFSNGTRVPRTDKINFPYGAYHMHCSPGNARHIEEPYNLCDAYSNPQAQEILQILPHPVWSDYGYPARKGEGWIGDPRTWELDVGRLSQSLYFYQDPGTKPAERHWPSIDLGTEIYISTENQVAEWIVTDFDIVVHKD